jgi:hypothetical protein
MVAILTLAPLPAAALDPDVSMQLERIASDPTTDVHALAEGARRLFFSKLQESCAQELQTTQEQCEESRALHLLDSTGVLVERCGALASRRSVMGCATIGAESLRMVAALKGDPNRDIEWESPFRSYLPLQDKLWNAAWLHCRSQGSYGDECLVRHQAALLDMPSAAGSFCANQDRDKRRCLESLLILAVYLEAIEAVPDSSRPL